MLSPMSKYRPARTADGGGGFTEAYGAAVVVYAAVAVHDKEVTATFREGTDVIVNDVLDAGAGAYYRVIQMIAQTRAPMKAVVVERIERPITL